MVHSSYERVHSAWYSHPVLVFVFLVSAPGIGGYLSNVHNGTGWNGFSERPYINPWNFVRKIIFFTVQVSNGKIFLNSR